MAEIALEYHPLAIRDGREAWEWYAQRSAQAAEKFESRLRQALSQVQEAPERWPLNRDGTRFRRLADFPYLVIYRVLSESRVRIVAIAHGRKRHGYWSRRK